MRHLRLILLFPLIFCQLALSAQNPIDSIRTDSDALRLVNRLTGYSDYYTLSPGPSLYVGDSAVLWRNNYCNSYWVKGDFDGNGTTDLLFNGYILPYINQGSSSDLDKIHETTSLVILNFGKDSLRIVNLQLAAPRFIAAKMLRLNGRDCIGTLQLKREYGRPFFRSFMEDTLIYAFGNFIEHRTTASFNPITSIHFCVTLGMTEQPGFGYIINGDSATFLIDSAIFRQSPSSQYDIGGIYRTRLDSETSQKINALLNYLHLPKERVEYTVPWTDDRIFQLKLLYENGESTFIFDDGGIGTYGLNAFYDILMSLRDSQHWIRTAPFSEWADPCQ